MWDTILSILVNGAIISALYAMIAIGFTMIFGVGGVLNLAHGAMIMAGAYVFLAFSRPSPFLEWLTLPSIVAFPLTIVVVALLSYGLYVALVRYVEENVVITFLATVVVATAATEVLLSALGTSPEYFTVIGSDPGFGSFVLPGSGLSLLGTYVSYTHLAAFIVSWIAIVLLWAYVTRTDGGRSIVATSMSERGARLTGVDIGAVRTRTWLVAGALAAVAGIFLVGTRSYGAQPTMWLEPLALAFIIVVIGGIGSIKGSIVAAYLVGYLETIVANGPYTIPVLELSVLGQSYRGVVSLLLLVVVLLVLPQGLYGREFVHE